MPCIRSAARAHASNLQVHWSPRTRHKGDSMCRRNATYILIFSFFLSISLSLFLPPFSYWLDRSLLMPLLAFPFLLVWFLPAKQFALLITRIWVNVYTVDDMLVWSKCIFCLRSLQNRQHCMTMLKMYCQRFRHGRNCQQISESVERIR